MMVKMKKCFAKCVKMFHSNLVVCRKKGQNLYCVQQNWHFGAILHHHHHHHYLYELNHSTFMHPFKRYNETTMPTSYNNYTKQHAGHIQIRSASNGVAVKWTFYNTNNNGLREWQHNNNDNHHHQQHQQRHWIISANKFSLIKFLLFVHWACYSWSHQSSQHWPTHANCATHTHCKSTITSQAKPSANLMRANIYIHCWHVVFNKY